MDEENKSLEPRVVKVVPPILSKVYEPPPVSVQPLRPSLPGRAEMIEREEPPSLLAHWRVLRKRRWTVLTVLIVLFTVVLIGTLKQKPIYQAQALLEIEKERPNIVTMQDMFELVTISDSYLETQYKILRSETLAQRVIEQLRLDQREEFNPEVPRKENAREPVEAARGSQGWQTTLARFHDRLTIDPVKHSRLVEIRFESEDPVLAAGVVNALANSHIEQSLQVRWEATQKASEWLSEQLLQLKARLEKSENELQAYARQKGLLFLESEKGIPENIVNERLRQLQEELSRAQAARYEKEPLYRLVQAGDYGSLPGVADNKLMQELTVRLAELHREQALLGTTFTPGYFKVKQLQSQIDEIEAVLTRERKRAAERITNEYLAASRRETLVQQAFEGQQKQANLIAERSVQYNILKREVETNKQLYEGLLQRLKEAGVSAGLKASNIRIVDAAEEASQAQSAAESGPGPGPGARPRRGRRIPAGAPGQQPEDL